MLNVKRDPVFGAQWYGHHHLKLGRSISSPPRWRRLYSLVEVAIYVYNLVEVAVHVYNWVEVAVHYSLVEVAANVYNCVITRRAVTRVMSPL